MTQETTFDDFQVGDYAVFERTFAPEEFASFSRLSGDENPLHHDKEHAAKHAPSGAPIVPLHMSLAPLSMIAGMIFPGEPSLYLSHDVQATKPVMYGEPLRYSARIEAINSGHRILTLRVLALRGTEIVLDARMRVQATFERWQAQPKIPIQKAAPGCAIITGASGEIGSAIASALAKAGWRLVLLDRGGDSRRDRLRDALGRSGADARFIAADLASVEGRRTLREKLSSVDDPSLIVHAASPGVSADVNDLVDVNFTALKDIAGALMPAFLARQSAAVMLIGSTAVRASIPGWESYAGAKAMAMNFIDAIERRYASYGVRGLTLMPGMVATKFSQSFRAATDAVLLPGEVAEAAVALVDNRQSADNVLVLEAARTTRGRYGFFHGARQEPRAEEHTAPLRNSPTEAATPRAADRFSDTIRNVLKLSGGYDLHDGGLGITPGWDSMKHIEIILAIETDHGVSFSSSEIEAAHSFENLIALCRRKSGTGAPA